MKISTDAGFKPYSITIENEVEHKRLVDGLTFALITAQQLHSHHPDYIKTLDYMLNLITGKTLIK